MLGVFTIIFTVIGSSLAYLSWQTSTAQQTSVTFTTEVEFSCSADGGTVTTLFSDSSTYTASSLVNTNNSVVASTLDTSTSTSSG